MYARQWRRRLRMWMCGRAVVMRPESRAGSQEAGVFKGMLDSLWPRWCGKRTGAGAQETAMAIQLAHLQSNALAFLVETADGNASAFLVDMSCDAVVCLVGPLR